MKFNIRFDLQSNPIVPDLTVERVRIKRNVWDNCVLYVGRGRVRDSADQDDLVEYAKEKYPNAEIIIK